MTGALPARIAAGRPAAEAVLAAFVGAAEKIGIEVSLPAWDEAIFSFRRDPCSGEESLVVHWRVGEHNTSVSLHGDGRIYGEMDVLVAHPGKQGWFVEALEAWGSPGAVKCEPRLLRLPE